jgi:hypothetical protein
VSKNDSPLRGELRAAVDALVLNVMRVLTQNPLQEVLAELQRSSTARPGAARWSLAATPTMSGDGASASRPEAASPSRRRGGYRVAELTRMVVEYVRQHPSASMGDLLADLGASRPHLKQALRQARENGQIELIGQWRGARYRAVGAEPQPPG